MFVRKWFIFVLLMSFSSNEHSQFRLFAMSHSIAVLVNKIYGFHVLNSNRWL